MIVIKMLCNKETCTNRLFYSDIHYKKAFFIHYKFEGNNQTLREIEKKLKLDSSIIRFLTVKYKKLDTKNEFFSKKDK